MEHEVIILIVSATTIACLHTASGPDHYLPFIALSKAKQWSLARTLWWTLVCGLGHIASSLALASAAAALGWSVHTIRWLEHVRGGIAGWALLVFGALYLVWGFIWAKKMASHNHFDFAPTGEVYVFNHRHGDAVAPSQRFKVTPWVLFVVFVLGPCEPLIPLLYVPAVQNSFASMVLVVGVYGFFTLATMVAMVLLGMYGFSMFSTAPMEKHMHTLAGLALLICGAGMVFWQW